MQVMDFIFKRNLWKFFKALQVQANQMYCLLVASPIHYAWITIINRTEHTIQKRITIAQFVKYLTKMPSSEVFYQMSINLYGGKIFEAKSISDLNIKKIETLFLDLIAYHCVESIKQGKRLELTPRTIRHYKFKARYIEDLKTIIEQCNNMITENNPFNNH